MSFANNRRLFVSTLISALFFAGCSSGGSTSPPTSNKISVTPSPAILEAGSSGIPLSASLILSSGGVDDTATFTWQSSDSAIVSVNASGLATGLKVGVATITAASSGVTGSVSVGVVSANKGAVSLTLSGKAEYQDRVYDLKGFTGTLVKKPIRNVVIEVVAIDGFKVIGTGTTDTSTGNFNLTVNNTDERRGGVYLRVISRTDPSSTVNIEVRNNKNEQALLSFTSPGIDDSVLDPFSATQQDVLATVAAKIGGAFNIIDVMSDASALVKATGLSCPPPNTTCPPLATVFWEPGSAEGTFYDDSTDTISILGGGTFGGDTDEYDDAIIAHEYAHFIISKFSRDDSPGGQHNVLDNGQDIRLSWSEGWATFFPAVVLNSPLYVDTQPGGTLASFNIEDYSGISALADRAIYTTNEIAVAGVLWDLFDPVDNNEGDPLALSFSKIFQTVLNFPASPKPTTLETFWTTFSSEALTTGSSTAFQTILQGRQIKLFADTSEAGSEPWLVVGGKQTHTLYKAAPSDPVGDVDIIPFSVTSGTTYNVRTSNLTNGADTMLTINGPSGEVFSNDNFSGLDHSGCGVNPFTGVSTCPANNTLNLSSSVTFTPQGDGMSTATVTRSDDAPPSAGLFGEYEIELIFVPEEN
ncbi:MAG: Ig-like domain-containing protein [Nitrospirota bacterium]|nr:Ig-like domain-containing protein [Nitrospirota bacterium]